MSDSATASEKWAKPDWLPSRIGPWLILHVVVWTLYATISNGPADIHHDMAEAYAWGREFQLGYFKHPPFWAWVAGAWFAVMPRADWAFYLLSSINAALGLWAVWLIAGRVLTDWRMRMTAALLLELVPFYHFLSFKFNANTILISLWAWAIYFFLRVVEDRDLRSAVGLGLVAGIGLLSKYYFALLLVSFGIAALVDERRREIVRSPAPWIAAAIMLIVIAPHVWWLTQNDFAPFRYISDTTQQSRGFIAWKAAQFAIGCALFHIAVIAFLGVFSGSSRIALIRFFSWRDASPTRRRLLLVAVAPPLLTIASALALNVKIDTNFAIGIFPVIPLLLLTTPGLQLDDRAHDWLKRIVAGFMAVMLIASPVIAYVRFAQGGERADEPRAEAARALQAIWTKDVGKPLAIVAGSWPYADEAPFYASGAVSHFISLSPRLAPWIDAARLKRDGVAVICLASDAACVSEARRILPGPLSETPFAVRKRFLGRDGREERFIAVIQAPAN